MGLDVPQANCLTLYLRPLDQFYRSCCTLPRTLCPVVPDWTSVVLFITPGRTSAAANLPGPFNFSFLLIMAHWALKQVL